MNNIFFLRIVDMAIVHLVRYHMSEFRNMHIPDLIIKRNEEKKYYAAACQQSMCLSHKKTQKSFPASG